jgi:hypothetical protein
MSKRLNLVGQKFNRLKVLAFHSIKNNATQWLCKCDCGETIIVAGYKLKSGHTQSCGCLAKENFKRVEIEGNKKRFVKVFFENIFKTNELLDPGILSIKFHEGLYGPVSPRLILREHPFFQSKEGRFASQGLIVPFKKLA